MTAHGTKRINSWGPSRGSPRGEPYRVRSGGCIFPRRRLALKLQPFSRSPLLIVDFAVPGISWNEEAMVPVLRGSQFNRRKR